MPYDIEDIEDAILTVLKNSDLADIAKTIDSYHGEVEDLVNDAKTMIVPLPAVFVVYGGSTFDEPANMSFDDEMYFSIVFVAKDLRGRASLRTGIYAMLKIAKSEMIGNDLGFNDIEPLRPVRIEPLVVTKALSIYGLDVKTTMSLD